LLDQITPLILTRDEEANLARTLGQLTWATEVVVIDSLSSDGTVEIARAFTNVRVVQRDFDDHATQWSFGQSQVRTPWLLSLDADYFLPEAFIEELRALRPGSARAYRASFRYAVHGRVLRASLYPPRVVLASTAHARFWLDGHTQRIAVDGEVADLVTPLIHDDRKSFAAFLDRQRRYMRQEAQKLRSSTWTQLNWTGRIRRLIFVAPVAVVLHALFAKGLILDGRAGLRYVWERFVAELMLSRELLRR
jgi:glycosyltransferase involved in cell wall biosynthesis